ncbi:prepilin peptidase [Candidatus Saganbacteria bacterium]|nr:prepilin peptidase [Candidatus Saganbacteria bacterium]
MFVNIFVFTAGLIVGSFLNVCISRLPEEKSVAYPPSHCPNCNKLINFYDNIPVLSYLILEGKCRTCKQPISLRYPIVELLTGFLFILINSLLGFGTCLSGRQVWDLGFYFYASFISFLLISFFSDLETQIVPDQPFFVIIPLALIYNFISGNIISSMLGLVSGFSILYTIGFLGKLYYKKDVLGGGDIKLAAAFGVSLGYQGLFLALLLGYFIGAASAAILVILKRKTMKDYIPFAPALTTGALVALFWGKFIINYYIANFL